MSPSKSSFAIPANPVPVLPLRNGVLFPGTTTTVPVGRSSSVALTEGLEPGAVIVLATQRDRSVDEPGQADLFPIAVYARVRKVFAVAPGQYRVVLEGAARCHLAKLTQTTPYLSAEVFPATELRADETESEMLADSLVKRFWELGASVSEGLKTALSEPDLGKTPARAADLVAAALGLPMEKEAAVLLELDVSARLRLLHGYVAEALELASLRTRIEQEVREGLSKGQREALLRQHLKAIQRELGDDDDPRNDLKKLEEQLQAADLPEEAREVAERELKRLQAMGPGQAEYHVNRRYLELIAELPWSERAATNEDIAAVMEQLDADHYGLDEVKRRIVEHLAVRKLTGRPRGTQLCLVGPPGVGKTSLGKSIADATGRPFVRIALGGVRDEAEIRGHRRTYVGSLPGRILAGLRKAKARNPVMLIDEIDKLGQGIMGNPEAALLEVLDPEQNSTFTDHYLELPFDLSEVLFVCTANSLDTLAGPLRDRLEIISIEGYTHEEKLQIARRHLLPRRLEDHGLDDQTLHLEDPAWTRMVVEYTREAGVRQLDRELVKICRAVTLEVARHGEGKAPLTHVTADDLPRYLGKPRFFDEVAERTAQPGVAVGLAWTPVGGDVLFIETSRMPGKGRIEITGQLGDVMRESARAASSYLRSHAAELGVPPDFLERQDLHIHVPAGATPKDGPSAGVTIYTALTSLLTGRAVRSDTAMTGECTLRGRVLPVGGIKAKVLAAHRAGIRRVILPRRNERDLEEVPESVRAELEFLFAEEMHEVLAEALTPAGEPQALEVGDERQPNALSS